MLTVAMRAVPFILGEAYVSRSTLGKDRPGRPGLIPVAASCISYAAVRYAHYMMGTSHMVLQSCTAIHAV